MFKACAGRGAKSKPLLPLFLAKAASWARNSAAVLLTLGLLSLLPGCSSVVANPAPLPVASQGKLSEYRIQPGDEMDVKFFFNPELNESVTVRPDGRISLQLANELPAAGLTPVELSQELKRSYARELNNPELTVILRKFAGQRVYVGGEVNKPGFVALAPEMTVLDALQTAGGLKDSARRNEIVVVRRQPQGKPQVFTLDLDQIISGSNTGENVTLRPLDVVYAPKSPIANVNQWVDQYLRQMIPIGTGFGYNL
jgi:polysaccharide biosynthesis/export protein PslD